MVTATVRHARLNLSKLLARVAQGEEVVIRNRTTPVARLVRGTGPLVSSDLLVPGFASVLARKRREGALSCSAHRRVWALFQEHVTAAHWSLIGLTRQDYRPPGLRARLGLPAQRAAAAGTRGRPESPRWFSRGSAGGKCRRREP